MAKITDKIRQKLEKLRSVKHIEIVIAVLAIAIMLVVYFSSTSCSQSENTGIQSGSGEYDYYASVVDELERKLSQIDGVGDISVLVNWSGSADAETQAKPEGVIIICEGGNNISVKLKLISSVASYFGISENKINVLAKTIN